MNKKIKLLLIIEELYEDLEVWYPKIRLEDKNISVVVAGPELKVYHGKKGLPIEPDIKISDVNPSDFDGIIIPGGFAPDRLRRIQKVLEIVKEFDKEKKLVAFICHAGWVPISAKILKGRRGTSFYAIKDDMENAGMQWQDSPVVVDDNLISSRQPSDLEYFCKNILNFLNPHS